MPPTADASPSPRRTVLAAAAGFVLAAVIALVLALTGVLPGKSEAKPSGASIDLPRTFAGHVPVSMTAPALANPKQRRFLAANDRYFTTHTSQALRSAYQGAGAAVSEYYADNDLNRSLVVWAVRAHSPPPVVPYSNPRYLGLAAPLRQVVRIGPVYCDVRRAPVTAGRQVPPKDVFVSSCQRTSASLTVWVIPSGSEDVSHRPAGVAMLVDRMWNEVG